VWKDGVCDKDGGAGGGAGGGAKAGRDTESKTRTPHKDVGKIGSIPTHHNHIPTFSTKTTCRLSSTSRWPRCATSLPRWKSTIFCGLFMADSHFIQEITMDFWLSHLENKEYLQ